jgi:hypothetical protein
VAQTDRRLNDGQVYGIVKVFYDPVKLERRLETLGWKATISATPRYFIYGNGTPNNGTGLGT